LLDRHRTLLILVNLFTNARQATSRNTERHGQIRVRGEVADDGQRLRITVTDNGDGIGPGDLAQVFEHGYTTRADGHGFGLHSSAIAAREMGGSLNAYSDGAGTGASFTLDVPLSREPVMA
jgi:signal transduction histidine kinase